MSERPPVSVVVPFAGDERGARALRVALSGLELGEADELIVADNSVDAIVEPLLEGIATIVIADGERSSYHARNTGAALASCAWILFLDADCAASCDLLERYFKQPAAPDCGILAGAIVDSPDQDSLLARYTGSRGFYDGERGIGANGRDEGGAAPSGNLMVRRAAFEELGGFAEGIRSAGDFDLCWRAQGAGWRLVRRPGARVTHRHRDDLASFLSMQARYGAGASWINRRYPGSSPRWPLVAGVLGSARDVVVNLLGRRPTEALYRAIDAVGLVAFNVGYARSNDAPGWRDARRYPE